MSNYVLRDIINDIKVDLKQKFDDKQIEDTQIGYWILTMADRLKSQHINKRESGQHLHIYGGLPIETFDQTTNPNQIKGRKYVKLPSSIYDYDQDGGIQYIAYYDEDLCKHKIGQFANIVFNRTSPDRVERLYMNDYEKPSKENPYFYRAGEYVYLLGLECSDVSNVEMGIYATFPSIRDVDIDAKFDFPQELLTVLKRHVLDLGRFILMMPEERLNDGNDDKNSKQVPTGKLVSVNDPAISTDKENE